MTHDECAKHYKKYVVERTAEEALTVKTTETTPLTFPAPQTGYTWTRRIAPAISV
jgi:hypothetical protein